MENSFGGSMQTKSELEGGFADIPPNRTLIAGQYTAERPDRPEIVPGLQNLSQLFGHYKPEASVDFRDLKGNLVVESIKFRQIDDFGIDTLLARSPLLQRNAAIEDEYLHIANELRNNKQLRSALEDPQARGAVLETIHAMIATLKTNS